MRHVKGQNIMPIVIYQGKLGLCSDRKLGGTFIS